MSTRSRSRPVAAADASGADFILPPELSRCLRLTQHPVIADNCNATGLRRFNAAVANPALKGLKGFQFLEEIGAVFGFDEMDKAIVVEPQRQIAKAIGLRGLQFLEYLCDQPGISVRRLGLCLIPYQGPFHRYLHRH